MLNGHCVLHPRVRLHMIRRVAVGKSKHDLVADCQGRQKGDDLMKHVHGMAL
jgi:hypothetical protein